MHLSWSSHITANSERVYIPQMPPNFLGEQELGKEFRDDQFTWGNEFSNNRIFSLYSLTKWLLYLTFRVIFHILYVHNMGYEYAYIEAYL